jgi:hypothetical protein
VKNDFINLMATDWASGLGSYNYRGHWNWLDQIIISKNITQSNFRILSGGALQSNFLLYESPLNDFNKDHASRLYPARTFGGSVWYGGFSDHLPVYFQIGSISR